MIGEMIERFPTLAACESAIAEAKAALIACFEKGGKLLLCGNGGSCADCEHIVGELMKGFRSKRPLSAAEKEAMQSRFAGIDEAVLGKLQKALPAISLPSFTALNMAFANDVDAALVYAQAVFALGRENDILLAISTSGNSKNVVEAAKVAKAMGVKVIALTGGSGGILGNLADLCICVPETETYKVQELHLPVYHCLCEEIESYFFEEGTL